MRRISGKALLLGLVLLPVLARPAGGTPPAAPGPASAVPTASRFVTAPEEPCLSATPPPGRFLPQTGEAFRAMLPWNWASVLPAAGLAAVTLPLYLRKDDIQRRIGLGDGEVIRFVEGSGLYVRFERLGDRWTVPAITGAFLLGGLAGRSPREFETGLMLTHSLLGTGVGTLLGQFVLAEERPYAGGHLAFFEMDGHGVSGHSALAASIVRPLEHQYLRSVPGEGRRMTALKLTGRAALYTAPILVGVARVRSNRHYLWNVVLGLAVGYAAGDLAVDLHERRVDGGTRTASGPGVRDAAPQVELEGLTLRMVW